MKAALCLQKMTLVRCQECVSNVNIENVRNQVPFDFEFERHGTSRNCALRRVGNETYGNE